tara:strand:+ start:307 stop:660 length:354 start_codon:yes stop_codon:yes gene_type:complete
MVSKYQIMYWKEIPVQIKVDDGDETISHPLDSRFQQAVDAISMLDGSMGSDDYLMGWNWGNEIKAEGSAKDISNKISEKYNLLMPKDFVARIRDLHKSGKRTEIPGSIDHWMDENDK